MSDVTLTYLRYFITGVKNCVDVVQYGSIIKSLIPTAEA